jgi:hypothetical protein
MRKTGWILVFFFLPAKAFAQSSIQDSSRLIFTGISVHAGGIVTQPRLKAFAQSHPVMLQADFSFIKNTSKAWSECNCYSRTGFSLSYIDFKNEQVLGKAVSLAGFAEPYLFYAPRFRVSLRGGAGLSYLTHVFDSETNPENLFFSSPLSFLLTLGLSAHYKISPSLEGGLIANVNHISNGGTRYPNWGINVPAVGVAVDYQVNRTKLISRAHVKLPNQPLKLILHAAAGRHLEDGTKKFVGLVNGGLIKQLSRVNGVGAGGELVYDAINKVLEERKGEPYNLLVASVSLQHYFYFGNLLFGQQLACYVAPPNSNAKKVYQVYTMELHISHQWYGGVLLRAHAGISDYLALSIGKMITLNR